MIDNNDCYLALTSNDITILNNIANRKHFALLFCFNHNPYTPINIINDFLKTSWLAYYIFLKSNKISKSDILNNPSIESLFALHFIDIKPILNHNFLKDYQLFYNHSNHEQNLLFHTLQSVIKDFNDETHIFNRINTNCYINEIYQKTILYTKIKKDLNNAYSFLSHIYGSSDSNYYAISFHP